MKIMSFDNFLILDKVIKLTYIPEASKLFWKNDAIFITDVTR